MAAHESLHNQIIFLSNQYSQQVEKSYLRSTGQFFTLDPNLLDELFKGINHIKIKKILEPSCGTGMVLYKCLEYLKAEVDAVELDKDVFRIVDTLFHNFPNVHLHNSDFLTFKTDKKYDLIVGNPPYFELPNRDISEEFNEIVCGRTNIYSLFLYRSINLLEDGGELRFVLPKSLLSGIYFSKIREYINNQCEVVEIVKFDNPKLFRKALQAVIILKLRKNVSPFKNRRYIFCMQDKLYLVENRENLASSDNTTSIKSLECEVKTGSIVWNKHKTLLSNSKNEGNLPLIYSGNILRGNLELNKNLSASKKQYLTVTDENKKFITQGPFLVLNRIIGNPPRINTYLELSNDSYFTENHVNVITGGVDKLLIIQKSLNDPRTLVYISELIGNTQLSKSELEDVVPIFLL